MYHGLNLLKRVLTTLEPEGIAGDLVTRGEMHQRVTRNADHLVTPAIRSEAGRRRFRHSIVSAYNALPPDFRRPGLSANHFKGELKQYLLAKQRGGIG